MARGKMNEEVLALGRAAKQIEDLEDPRAQARVASYLYLRFTAAGEQILPSEERKKHSPFYEDPEASKQPLLPHIDPAPIAPPTGAQATSAVPATTPASPTPAAAPGGSGDPPAKTGWGLSGDEKVDDDTPEPTATGGNASKPPAHKPKAKASKDGGWDLGKSDDDPDAEVEVKI